MKQFAPFFFFLLRFFGVYILGTLIYRAYLNTFDSVLNQVDGITWSVSHQTQWVLQKLGYACELLAHESEPSVKLFLENVYVARVVEGCNAISVMILFVAFVIAFKGKLKNTLLFILIGLLILHLMNILRIALLSIALLRYPESESFLHGVLFPSVIYGTVVLMWIVWVNKFSLHHGKK